MPLLPREQLQTQPGVVKVMMNTHVLGYLMGDLWGTSARLMASEKIRAEAEKRRSAEIMEAFGDVLTGVKRFEILSHLRDRVSPGRAFGDQDMSERSGSRRLFEFGESARVTNNAVNATVLFLDLRGFTKTSEGQISERDLAEELYTVFDQFVPHVRRFGGTVDKFLGDGIMVTWGTRRVDPLDTLNALRTAVLCQETLTRLRREGKTYFRMGIAIHYGRVHVARFIADDQVLDRLESRPGGQEHSIDCEGAIARLPAGARMIFVLHDIEGYRHDEIANHMNIAVGTSKAQLHRARRLLREVLDR